MSRTLPWFRLYSELLQDRKINRITRAVELPKCCVVGAWVTLLCLANDSPERGALMFADDMWLTDDEIAFEAGLDPITFGRLMAEFQRYGMVSKSRGYFIDNWDDRQAKSDSAAERMRRYRRRKRKAESAENDEKEVDVTPVTSPLRNGYGTERDKERDKEEDKRGRTDAPTRKRGTRLPHDWKPSESLTGWATEKRPDLHIPTVTASFRDYWTAKTGSGATKLDWDATFRNWVRREKRNSHNAAKANAHPARETRKVETI